VKTDAQNWGLISRKRVRCGNIYQTRTLRQRRHKGFQLIPSLCGYDITTTIIVIIIMMITTTILWCYHHDQCHCESSPGSFDECRLSAGWPPTVRPSQLTWAVSPPKIGRYTIHIHHRQCYYYSARKLILVLPSHGER